jgi:hypothetical protein
MTPQKFPGVSLEQISAFQINAKVIPSASNDYMHPNGSMLTEDKSRFGVGSAEARKHHGQMGRHEGEHWGVNSCMPPV